ncbi:fimbrillin family protein [Bacteroides sp.]
MKKIQFEFGGLLCLLLLAGCMERDLEIRPEGPGPTPEPDPEPEAVAVRLYTSIQTRSLVDEFKGTAVGVACGSEAGVYTEFWEGVATQNEIVLTPERYYPTDGSPLYVRGFYPPAPLKDGRLQYTLTGSEDLMLSNEQSASQDAPFTAVETGLLEYRHLLTLLNFHLELDGGAANWKVRGIRLNGLSSQVGVSLQTGDVLVGESTTSLNVYSASDGEQGLPTTDGKVTVPGHALVQPKAELTIDLVLAVDDDRTHDRVYKDLPVLFDGGAGEGGSAYVVKVSVVDYASAYAVASVVPWESGDDGFSDIATGN